MSLQNRAFNNRIFALIRYFQYDGIGSLRLVDGSVLVNNDRVFLESKAFRLNYTARSADSHKSLVVIENNFETVIRQQTFEFNIKDDGEIKTALKRACNANYLMNKLLILFVACGDNAGFRSQKADIMELPLQRQVASSTE